MSIFDSTVCQLHDVIKVIHIVLACVYMFGSYAFYSLQLYIQWSLRCKTPCCKTDLSYETALLPLQVVFLVQIAPRYETAPPRETASGLQKGRSYNTGTTVHGNRQWWLLFFASPV